MPEDLAIQIPLVKKLIEAFNLPSLVYPGWEADDIAGTVAKLADADGAFETFLVTPDKDFAQLVSERTSIYKPGRQGSDAEILDVAAICENWQIERPEQVIDILALWGDASDNIPGVPGVGEKTAKKLIAQFGSVEALLENTDQLKGKQKENVEGNKEQALLSKELVTILLDCPLTESLEDFKIPEERDDEKLRAFCVEHEFNAIGKRIFGNDFKAGRGGAEKGATEADLKTIKDFNKDYTAISADQGEQRAQFLATLSGETSVCFDIETDGLDEKQAKVIGVAFSTGADSGTYVQVNSPEILDEIHAAFWSRSGIEKIGHNLKFDLGVLKWRGYTVEGPFFDTMLAHSLIEPDQRHRMDYLAERYLAYTPISYDDVFGKKEEPTGQLNLFDDAEMSGVEDAGPEFEKVAEYAAEDADVTWQLAAKFRDQLAELNQAKVLQEIECPLVVPILSMEHQGVKVDTDIL
ncbi:MAG: 5'-3' exonuclease H3TH domain-containing protein, partial [Verrucomicrobiota bacterium]